MAQFINLTPHNLNVRNAEGVMITVAPSGKVARVAVRRVKMYEISGVIIWGKEMGGLVGLEGLEDAPENVLITSLAAKAAVKAAFPAALVVSPGDLLRDENGQPVGCDGLDE